MTDTRRDNPRTSSPSQTEEEREVDAVAAAADYQPRGGDDLVPPDEDRPADGELGAGD
jgi:hypothetical protein